MSSGPETIQRPVPTLNTLAAPLQRGGGFPYLSEVSHDAFLQLRLSKEVVGHDSGVPVVLLPQSVQLTVMVEGVVVGAGVVVVAGRVVHVSDSSPMAPMTNLISVILLAASAVSASPVGTSLKLTLGLL